MCSPQLVSALAVSVILLVVIIVLQKNNKNENFVSKYPFRTEGIYPGQLNNLPEIKKGVRPGNSPHRRRD